MGYEDGRILVTAHGFLSGKDSTEEKKSLEQYKADNASFWGGMLGIDGDFGISVDGE